MPELDRREPGKLNLRRVRRIVFRYERLWTAPAERSDEGAFRAGAEFIPARRAARPRCRVPLAIALQKPRALPGLVAGGEN